MKKLKMLSLILCALLVLGSVKNAAWAADDPAAGAQMR